MTLQHAIRTATPDDLDRLLAWGEKLYLSEKHFEPLLVYSEEEYRELYQKQFQNPEALFLIACLDDKPVGYLYAHIEPQDYLDTSRKECEIEVIYLEEPARGSGLAQELVQKCLAWVEGKDCIRVKAGIFAHNVVSQGLFWKCRFRPYHITFVKDL